MSALSTTNATQYQYFLSDVKVDMKDRREGPVCVPECAQRCVKNGVS